MPHQAQAKRVMSLKEPQLKMSKSHDDGRSRILINDSTEDISRKVRLARTDSIQGVTYDPGTRFGVSNLLELMSNFDPQKRAPNVLAQDCSSMTMRMFKEKVATTISDGLSEVRTNYQRLIKSENSHYLEDVAGAGAIRAQQKAWKMLIQVREAVGLQ